jgi:hypothetical protein
MVGLKTEPCSRLLRAWSGVGSVSEVFFLMQSPCLAGIIRVILPGSFMEDSNYNRIGFISGVA